MLERQQHQAQVGGEGAWQLLLRQGSVWRSANGSVPLQCQNGNLQVAGMAAPAELWLASSAGTTVRFNEADYRGRLRLLCLEDGLTAVNHLPLEDYIASVVGAEMPSYWPNEALRAQAVAARSYALAHLARPAHPAWNLGATPRWQAYSGLASESGPSRSAVDSTRGLILSYRGGIVESLYAANRELANEAHGQLGASMSQQGARMLALRGYRYSQILATYYRGASLARLRRSA
jgi:peptidoglycan hydrolase-like amidase